MANGEEEERKRRGRGEVLSIHYSCYVTLLPSLSKRGTLAVTLS